MVTLAQIKKAQERISGSIVKTPVIQTHDERFGSAFLKLENLQATGSFKDRGAVNKLKIIKEEGKFKGVIGASAGNHAQAVAFHGAKEGFSVAMIMPEHTPTVKLNATQRWGAQVHLEGETVDEGMQIARKISKEKNLGFVHAFDDPEVIAGQGTLGLEIIENDPDVDCIFVPVGGGGLASGVATAIKSINPKCKIIGVQSEKYHQVQQAFQGKDPKKVPLDGPTIADGIAVKGIGEFTLPTLRKYVDEIITVSEEEIADAILILLQHQKILAEGAGAAGYAAVMSSKVKLSDYRRPYAIISGGNIDMNLLSRIVEKGFLKKKKLLKVNVIISDRPGSLHRLTGVLKDLNVNILQIEHDRASTSIPYYNTGTNLLLETRGADHYDQVLDELKKHAYQVNVSS